MSSDYFRKRKINQSAAKKILLHPKAYYNTLEYQEPEDEDDSPALSMGSLVDCLITEPEKFDSSYYVIDESINCSDAVKKIVAFIHAIHLGKGELKDYKDEIIAHARANSYQTNYKDETLYNDIVKKGASYYNILTTKANRIGISVDQEMLAKEIKNSLLYGDFTKHEFFSEGNKEILYQLEIDWFYKGEECKSKLDLVEIDHDKMSITPKDVKTSSDVLTSWFRKSFHKYRYDFQAGFYHLAISHWRNENYPGYTIEPFRFIVESSKFPGSPIIVVINSECLYAIEDYEYNGVYYQGINTAFDLIRWHTENNQWDYQKNLYLNRGVLSV
jgi:hypothetical protein